MITRVWWKKTSDMSDGLFASIQIDLKTTQRKGACARVMLIVSCYLFHNLKLHKKNYFLMLTAVFGSYILSLF